jgi:hypothetical protein
MSEVQAQYFECSEHTVKFPQMGGCGHVLRVGDKVGRSKSPRYTCCTRCWREWKEQQKAFENGPELVLVQDEVCG